MVIFEQSNASACKKIEEGDEIVYVGGHVIVSGLFRNFILLLYKCRARFV